ncbi:Uncharacterized protein PBTT_10288 [Plasmodiophora brassicae]|nr:hypothetical protein PBRA_009102 [Plasmodiophora brassicae]
MGCQHSHAGLQDEETGIPQEAETVAADAVQAPASVGASSDTPPHETQDGRAVDVTPRPTPVDGDVSTDAAAPTTKKVVFTRETTRLTGRKVAKRLARTVLQQAGCHDDGRIALPALITLARSGSSGDDSALVEVLLRHLRLDGNSGEGQLPGENGPGQVDPTVMVPLENLTNLFAALPAVDADASPKPLDGFLQWHATQTRCRTCRTSKPIRSPRFANLQTAAATGRPRLPPLKAATRLPPPTTPAFMKPPVQDAWLLSGTGTSPADSAAAQ